MLISRYFSSDVDVVRSTLHGFAAMLLIVAASSMRGWPFPSLTSEPWIYQFSSSNIVLRYGFLAMFFAGVAGVCYHWVKLLQFASDKRLTAGVAAKVFVLWTLPLVFSVPLFSGDVYVYYVDGQAVERGYTPYESGVSAMGSTPIVHMVHPLWRDTLTMYGPIFVRMAQGVARLSGDSVITGVVLFRLIAIASVAIVGFASMRIASKLKKSPAIAFLVGALNPLSMLHLIGGAHNDATMLALLLGGLAIGLTAKSWWLRVIAIALCVAGSSFKIPAFAGVFILGWIWAKKRASIKDSVFPRILAASICGVAGAIIFALFSEVCSLGWGWTKAFDVPGLAHPLLAPANSLAMSIGGLFGVQEGLNSVTRALATLLAVSLAIWFIVRTGPKASDAAVLRGAGWALLALGWLGPAVYPWYLTWGIAVAAVAGAGSTRRTRSPLMAIVIVASFAVSPGGYGMLDLFSDWRRTVIAFAVTGVWVWAVSTVLHRNGWFVRHDGTRLFGSILSRLRAKSRPGFEVEPAA